MSTDACRWTVEFYDPVSGKWGKRTLKNKKSALVYMDGIRELLKQSGDKHPSVSAYKEEYKQDRNYF